jgi:hypothetical protein
MVGLEQGQSSAVFQLFGHNSKKSVMNVRLNHEAFGTYETT